MSRAMMLWCSERTRVKQDASSSSLYCFILTHTYEEILISRTNEHLQPCVAFHRVPTSLPNLEKSAKEALLTVSLWADVKLSSPTP